MTAAPKLLAATVNVKNGSKGPKMRKNTLSLGAAAVSSSDLSLEAAAVCSFGL